MEYAAYLAAEPHSDHPKCVSPILTRFIVRLNDDLDDQTRQRLRTYVVRILGTAGDGQDQVRAYMALDWLARAYAPAFLEAAGLAAEAAILRNLPSIGGDERARAARAAVYAAGAAVREVVAGADPAGDAARAAAARAAVGAAGGNAAGAAARSGGGAVMRSSVGAAARAVAWDAAWASPSWDALRPTVEMLRESAFGLLDSMMDPGGLHDVEAEEAWFEKTGRTPLV